MSDLHTTFTPYKQANEKYNSDFVAQMQHGTPTVKIEDYLFDQEYEFESEEQKALQERLANGEIKIARSAEDAKNGNWVDINSEWWGDKEGLRYETREEDGSIIIYEGDTPLGWTYPSEDNNFYGIKTENTTTYIENGKTYYEQENGMFMSIDGVSYKDENGNMENDIEINENALAEDQGLTYVGPSAVEGRGNLYKDSEGKWYYYDSEEGEFVPTGKSASTEDAQETSASASATSTPYIDTIDDGSASVIVDNVDFGRGGVITNSTSGAKYEIVEGKVYQGLGEQDGYKTNYEVYSNGNGKYFYRTGDNEITEITNNDLIGDKPQE